MISVSIHGEDELRRMARGVADGPDHLRANLARAVRRAAQPVLRDMKKAIATNRIVGFRTGGRPYRGPNTRKGLRASIAAVVEAEIDVGSLNPQAKFVVHSGRLGAKHRLPELIESGKVWRHPILGNRRGWAGSRGKPWFKVTYEKGLPKFSQRIDEAVARTARAIEGNG